MKKILLALVILVVPALSYAQGIPVVSDPSKTKFNWTMDFTSNLDFFQYKYEADADYTQIIIAPVNGVYSLPMRTTLVAGNHTFSVRACKNSIPVNCSADASITFTINSGAPVIPKNLSITISVTVP